MAHFILAGNTCAVGLVSVNGLKVIGRLSLEKGVQPAVSPGVLSFSLYTLIEEKECWADPAMMMMMLDAPMFKDKLVDGDDVDGRNDDVVLGGPDVQR
jgi:hypothetical protein